MHPHVLPAALRNAGQRVPGHFEVQSTVVLDGLAVEAKRTRAREPPADLARSNDVDRGLGQRIPGLTHPNQPAVGDEHANGLVIDSHPSQIGSSGDPAEGGHLPFIPHAPSLTRRELAPARWSVSVRTATLSSPVEDYPSPIPPALEIPHG